MNRWPGNSERRQVVCFMDHLTRMLCFDDRIGIGKREWFPELYTIFMYIPIVD